MGKIRVITVTAIMKIASHRENEPAEQILSRVLSEWDAGKQKIHYVLTIPKTPKQYRRYIIETIAMGVISCIFFLMSEVNFVFILIVVPFFTMLFYWMEGGKNNYYSVFIDRKNRKIGYSTYDKKISGGGRYYQPIELLAFRLHENDTGKYAQMRQELQQKIRAETVCTFIEYKD